MERLFDRLSLYEILSMIIPGGYVLLEIGARLGLSVQGCSNAVIDSPWNYFIFFVAAYLVGLIVDSVASYIFWPMRNNEVQIARYEFEPLITVKKYLLYCISFFAFFLFGVFTPYLLGANLFCLVVIILSISVVFFLWYFAFYPFRIKNAIDPAVHNRTVRNRTVRNRITVTDIYYSRYYYLQSNGKLETISKLEGQVAFLRNMCLTLTVFIIPLCNQGGQSLLRTLVTFPIKCRCDVLFQAILSVLTLVTMIARQHKIYYLVNSDYHYLKNLESANSNDK